MAWHSPPHIGRLIGHLKVPPEALEEQTNQKPVEQPHWTCLRFSGYKCGYRHFSYLCDPSKRLVGYQGRGNTPLQADLKEAIKFCEESKVEVLRSGVATEERSTEGRWQGCGTTTLQLQEELATYVSNPDSNSLRMRDAPMESCFATS
eukprot:5745910-Amphidinium_carterae.1